MVNVPSISSRDIDTEIRQCRGLPRTRGDGATLSLSRSLLRLANRARGKRSLSLRVNRLRLSYVEASKWCSTIRTTPIVAGGALSLDVVDAELSSASKAGSRVDPVSLKDPWCAWFNLWSRSPIDSSSSDRRSPAFLGCLGSSMSVTQIREEGLCINIFLIGILI